MMTPMQIIRSYWRWPMLLLAIVCSCSGVGTAEAQLHQRLVARNEAARLGLDRAWFAQVELDRARNEVERAILAGDHLVVLTTAGVVELLDANTGESVWTAPIGNPDYPSLGPAANDTAIAILNGSTLYVLDRKDGRPLKIRPVGGAPGASPALSNDYVFVPLINGRVEGYPLGESTLTPWYYQSFGRTMVPPQATPTTLAWTTDYGYLYVASAEEPGVKFRVETGSEFLAAPAYGKPNIYAANVAGEVFAIDESSGARRWKFASGFPVVRAPAAVANRLFVTTDMPALYAIDTKTGAGLWEAAGITQFAAATRARVYAIDELGAIVVLDAASGAALARMVTDEATYALVNDQTDRLYLVSKDGMVQCLHELGSKEPYYHDRATEAPPGESAQPSGEDGETSRRPEDEAERDEDPFTTDQPAEDADAMDDEAPAEEPDGESPFGVEGEEDPFGFEE